MFFQLEREHHGVVIRIEGEMVYVILASETFAQERREITRDAFAMLVSKKQVRIVDDVMLSTPLHVRLSQDTTSNEALHGKILEYTVRNMGRDRNKLMVWVEFHDGCFGEVDCTEVVLL